MHARAITLAIAGIVAVTGTACAVQLVPGELLEASRAVTRFVGLSPEGTEIWAKLSVARSEKQHYSGFDRIDREIGEQLALDVPDKGKLAALARAYASEKAAFELRERDQLIADAFRLPDADRKTLGRFLVRSRTNSKPAAPVLTPLPQ